MSVPKNSKIVLMCALRPDDLRGEGNLADALRAARDGISGAVELTISARRADTGFAPTPHQALTSAGPAATDLVVELSAKSAEDWEELSEAAAGVADALAGIIDTGKSIAFAGNEVAITAGTGPALLVFGLRRHEDLTQEQFMSHWFGDHIEVGREVEGVRYRQCHVEMDVSRDLSARLGFSDHSWDGVVLSYFDDVAAAVALMSSSGVKEALEDEKIFVDHANSSFGYYETL